MTDPIDRGVEQIHVGQPATDGAGVRMTRVIATAELDHFDPFLLLDEFRSDDPGDYIAGFPDHPHRGFETVTYMLAGAMKHGDNQGNTGLLGPGSVQWMTAGRGIVHSEMPQQEDGLMWGFQLWVNLPAEQKMVEPRYQDIPASDIPETRVGDNVAVRVIAGELNGVRGPVAGIATEPFYFDVRCESKAELRLPAPEGHNVFVYPYAGEIALGRGGSASVGRGNIALLGPGNSVFVSCEEPASFILVGGKPLKEPVARYGPFVMNTADEIRQAIMDFQAGRF
ncbi:MAG: quercetin 2,3-dioxygenase [Gammaproteobacteria bacterium]|jgi:redox-sensitive bicupin YhaK (pirin superfamily)|nr:quercetin 2,3-dioxygenase [Gammaproteobacteria bacterium]